MTIVGVRRSSIESTTAVELDEEEASAVSPSPSFIGPLTASAIHILENFDVDVVIKKLLDMQNEEKVPLDCGLGFD